MTDPAFDYGRAFSRNLGWVTEREQALLRSKTVAIAGMGGVGGHHLLALTRLGIGNFRIADFDHFELENFNRQAGASLSTLDARKAETMAALAREINPQAKIDIYGHGISRSNVDAFLADADVYLDGIDFFAFDARRAVFSACDRLGIPAVTAAPLGMGAALLVFMPGKMSFDEYFRWGDCSDIEKAVRFMVGLAPSMLHDYLVDATRINFAMKAGPSTSTACYLCAGMAATEALKILLERGPVTCAPRGQHFDAYRGKLAKTWRPWGNANPIQRALIAIGMRRFSGRAFQEQVS
ncbi:MAG: hypothetical protein RL404_726 [Pseudomonadota bacterium]